MAKGRSPILLVLAAACVLGGPAPLAWGARAVESSSHPEVRRRKAIPPERPDADVAPAATPDAQQAGEVNLIQNPSVESAGPDGLPEHWRKGGFGSNTRLLTYPVTGFNSPKGLLVTISSYSSGDAKWYFDDVPITPGRAYLFADAYSADVESLLTARFMRSDGSFFYRYLATLAPSQTYTNATVQFTAPPEAVSATVFHVINRVGSLRTDECSLREVVVDQENFIANPGFETPGTNGRPLNWGPGTWGTHDAVFTYPVPGVRKSRAAQVAITQYQRGDAKWVFAPVELPRGVYTYSTAYKATVPTTFTVSVQHDDGRFSYLDVATLRKAGSFIQAAAEFWVPMTARKVTVFHLLQANGRLIIDDVALTFTAAPTGIFTTGAVSLAFDDGWLSQYEHAVPVLNAAGFKATFYIATRQLLDDGFAGFMSRSQVVDLFNQGHEIGAHTRTHANLPTLSRSKQREEIRGSRKDLLDLRVGPVATFAYPYGAYNAATIKLVQEAGFTSGRATLSGTVHPAEDLYQLRAFSVESTTSLEQVQQMIDAALAAQEWLILTFHHVQAVPDRYAILPETFARLVEYLALIGARVIPIAEGMQSLHHRPP